jgi:hypothetical protein
MKRKAEAADGATPAKDAKLESEVDAPEDKRPKITETISFQPKDTTVNVIPTMGGKTLMTLSEGGMQYLLAGARANVGVKSGRYMFEVRMAETLTSAVAPGGGRSPSLVKHLVRVGVSLGDTSLFLGSDNEEHGICFDNDGFYYAPGQKRKDSTGCKFGKDNTIALVLNLDAKDPCNETVSLFKDGVRVCQPIKLPESFRGQALFPHVAYRNASVQVHFGPQPLVPLSFKCRTFQTASCADAVVTPAPKPKDGKHDVIFPIGIPDEGTFPWLESFLSKNPGFVELSDRKIVEWAQKSGLWKPKGSTWKSSNDRPEFNFGIQALDDLSPRKVIQIVAPLVPRDYVVMEVRSNLMPELRKEHLKRFHKKHYRRIAKVVMGDPDEDFLKQVHGIVLKAKQEKLNEEWRKKKAEREKKKQMATRQKQIAEARKAAEQKAAKKAEEAEKKKKEAAQKKKEEEEAKEKAEYCTSKSLHEGS